MQDSSRYARVSEALARLEREGKFDATLASLKGQMI